MPDLIAEIKNIKRTQTYIIAVIAVMTLRDLNAFYGLRKLIFMLIESVDYFMTSIWY